MNKRKSKRVATAKAKPGCAATYGSAYSRGILNEIKGAALKIKGATSVSHIYPRAYCIAKPAPMCAVFVTPWMDAEPQVRKPEYASSHTVGYGVEKVKVGDWCAIAYVTTPGCGTLWVVDMPNDADQATASGKRR